MLRLLDLCQDRNHLLEECVKIVGPALSHDDWVFLNGGDRVVVQRPNETLLFGTVDDVAEDASLIWVQLDVFGRILVTETDDVLISFEQPHAPCCAWGTTCCPGCAAMGGIPPLAEASGNGKVRDHH